MNGQEFHWFGKIIDLFDSSASYFAYRKNEDPFFLRVMFGARVSNGGSVAGGVDPGASR
jgi:hypothetical protein